MTDNTNNPSAFDASLDTTGLYCPQPIMLMHNKVRDMTPGQVLKGTATYSVIHSRCAKILSIFGTPATAARGV